MTDILIDSARPGSEAKDVIRLMSEQSASFESLGVFLQMAWIEVENGTVEEPSPNFFRLAVCCSIFDKVAPSPCT